MPANPKHRPGYKPGAKRPTTQPSTPREEITPGGFSEAMAAYHDTVQLSAWEPHRPERPIVKGLSKPLRVVSDYEPAGDQPTAIKELTGGLGDEDWDQVLLGATGTGKTFTMAKVIEAAQRPALILAPNKTLAAQLYGEFKAFFPDNAVEYFVSYYDYYQPEAYVPRTDTYIEKESSINEQIDRMRHAATRALLERDDTIIVASVSCIYGIGSVETYAAMTFSLKLGETIERKKLLSSRCNTNATITPLRAAVFACAAMSWKFSLHTMKTAPGVCLCSVTTSKRFTNSIR